MKYIRRNSEKSLGKVKLTGFAAPPLTASPDGERLSNVNNWLPDHLFRTEIAEKSESEESGPVSELPGDGLPEIGAIVGKFRLDRLLGIGAFAVVYQGTHLALSMSVALKFLRPHLSASRPGLVRQLHAEAELAARINHSNVVRILDIGDSLTLPYVVMEFVDGESLASKINREGPMGTIEAIDMAIHASRGLAAGGDAGLIHRDVKPANILLTRTGEAKIADFGLATQTTEGASVEEQGVRSVIGTPAYMAPEQAASLASLDARADTYALGATLFHALAGRPPFKNTDVRALLREKQLVDAPDLRSLIPAAPPRVAELVASMLQRDRDKRPATMRHVVSALEALRTLQVQSPKKNR
jgi:eukaryotic-like serine/threonine-protein kinase